MTLRSVVLAAVAFAGSGAVASAHDIWINKGGYRSPAGEWCCGVGDCFVVPKETVAISGTGYVLRNFGEVVPFSEAQPSQDGAFWRCKRADGSRRCFFAPPPSS